jgi:hypothetical protein
MSIGGELRRDGTRLLGGVRDPPARYGNAVFGEELLRLMLEQVHV